MQSCVKNNAHDKAFLCPSEKQPFRADVIMAMTEELELLTEYAAGKKTFFLIEGQRHRDENLDNYLENVGRAFSLPMDQLMYYYCAHEMNMENGEVMTEATWKEVCRIAYLKK